MKASQCIDANWSPPLDELIGEGCQAIEGSGKVKGDLQRSTIIAIVCGSLAAFVLLIIVVLLLTLKRKYHTFFPCFRKASKPGHLPATKQPRYTPSTAGNSGYLSGIDRIESDRSNATTYTIVSNPYRPTSQLVSMDALIANSQYAPVLKTPTADGNSTISTSHYAPMSVISADSYGDCDVRGSPRSAYTPMHPGEIAHKGPPTDDEEEETLYEDPVQSPVNNTTAKSLNSRAPRLPKMPKYDSTDEDSCANYDEPVAVKTNDAPPPPTAGRFSLRAPLHTESSIDNEIPPVANDEKHVTKPSDQTAAGIRPIFKPYDSSSSEDEYERVGIPKNDKIKRNRQSVPDYNPPPPPAPKPRFTKKPIVPADAPLEPPERPAKPSKAIIPSAAAQHWKKIPARTSEYIDFKDRVSSVPAVIAPGLRESSM